MKEITLFDIVLAEVRDNAVNSPVSFYALEKIKNLSNKIDEMRKLCDSCEIHSIQINVDGDQKDMSILLFVDSIEINKNDQFFANLILCADYVTYTEDKEGELVIGLGVKDLWEG